MYEIPPAEIHGCTLFVNTRNFLDICKLFRCLFELFSTLVPLLTRKMGLPPVLVVVISIAMGANGWTDTTCKASYPGLPYACNWGSACACGSVTTSSGTLYCCGNKPPACERNSLSIYSDCSTVSYCHTAWANYGSCTGCGSSGVQTQTQPCVSKATGSPNTRTISVTCGMTYLAH